MSAEAAFSEAVSAVAPVAIRTAATLRLADHIAAGQNTLPELADRAGVHPEPLRRLMRFLIVREVFTEHTDGTYALTPLSSTLQDHHPSQLRSWLDQTGIGRRMDAAVGELTEALRTGRTPYPWLHGTDFYTDLATPRPGTQTFNNLRQAHAEGFAEELTHAYAWENNKRVVDVGGGTGTLAEHLLGTFAHLHVTLVDLEAAVSLAVQRITGTEYEDRFTPAPGSFFEPLPSGADVYTLVNVLHNWDDEHAVRILQQCARAARAEGTVLVVERLADTADPYAITAMDLRMFLLLGGQERTLVELDTLAHRAGLQRTSHHEIHNGLQIVGLNSERAA